MAEKNLIGELDMYREAGIKPNFSDIAKRYGKDRHTVAAYWRAEGGRPRDGRADRAGSFDAHIEEVAAKAQLPGVTKKGIHEWLLHRYPGENLAGYNAFTQFMCVLSSSRRQNRRYDFDTFGVSRADLFFYSRDLPSISAFSILLLAPPNSTSLPWCMMRSMMAEASLSSPNTTPHLLNSIFVVITRLRFS